MANNSARSTQESREAFFKKLNEAIDRGARPHLQAIEREQERNRLEFYRRGHHHVLYK